MSKVIVGEHLNYEWTDEDIEIAINLGLDGYNLCQIAEFFKREIVETLILMDELSYIRRIPKNNNLFGRAKEKA
jgi:hypothetical protein